VVESGGDVVPLLLAHGGLFLSALVAATLLPMQSEAVLTGLLLAGYSPVSLVVAASLGNVLGSLVNWGLGLGVAHFRDRPWFPVKPDALERAGRWYRRWGKWSLLLSWAPVIGDPLTLAAGVMREPLAPFLLLVTLAKVGRYLVLTAAILALG
jgi:membrane protein YqaA with SNARE-associated domain